MTLEMPSLGGTCGSAPCTLAEDLGCDPQGLALIKKSRLSISMESLLGRANPYARSHLQVPVHGHRLIERTEDHLEGDLCGRLAWI